MDTRQKPLMIALLALAAACASNPTSDGEDGDDTDDMVTPSTDRDAGGGGAPATPRGDAQSSTGGGGDSGGGSGGPGSVECPDDTPANDKDLIATFEDMTVGVNPAGGWVGGFYIFNDKMNDPSQTATVEPVSRCSDGSSQFAYCTKGSGFTVWGAGIGTDLGAVDPATMKKSTVDLSAYSGVSFYVRRNGGTMPGTAKLIIPDENTSDEGGKCSNAADAPTTMKCDPFTAAVPLSNTWTKQTIMFSKLKQGAWGKAVPAFAADKAYGIQLQFGPGMPFDVCFDQLVLVR
jgi:hypothetical protein